MKPQTLAVIFNASSCLTIMRMKNPLIKAFRYFVDFDFNKIFDRPDLPLHYRIVNWFFLLLTLPWPFLLFASLFLFDDPSNESKAYPIFILILIYPWVIFICTILGFKNFGEKRNLAYAFTILSALVIGLLIYEFSAF
ncbi:MAG: hypothetical protein ACK57D_15475 [Sphingobacteriales bacterium]